MNREGFWANEYYPSLPSPVPQDKPWIGQDEFLKALEIVEKKAHDTHFRGWSNCRVCAIHNGSVEYEYGDWVWPQGLRHYIVEHNVRPSLAFQEFIIGHLIIDK